MRLLSIISHMKFKQIHLQDHNALLGQFEINQKTWNGRTSMYLHLDLRQFTVD